MKPRTNPFFVVVLVLFAAGAAFGAPAPPSVDEAVRLARNGRTAEDAARLLHMYSALDEQARYADLDAIHDALRDGAADPFGRPCLQFYYALLRHRTGKLRPVDAIALRQKWTLACPNSVAGRVLLAEAWLDHAQEARGNGFVSGLNVDAVQTMYARAKKAIPLLNEAAASPQVDAQVYASRVRTARYYDWPLDRTQTAFSAAVKADRRYTPAYQQMAIYLLPRWYGKAGTLGSFVRRSVQIRGDNIGCADIASIVYPVEAKQLFTYDGVPWSLVKAGLDEKIKALPQGSPSLLDALNCTAALACLADDRPTARAAFHALGAHADALYFQSIGGMHKWQSWAGR